MPAPNVNVNYIVLDTLVEALANAKTRYVASPVNGYVREIHVVCNTAVDADNILTSSISGTAITGGTLTLTTANSVAGTVSRIVPTAANYVRKGQNIGIATDGGGGAGECRCSILIEQV